METRRIIIAGIGSRKTPKPILREMTEIGRLISKFDGWVRSGHAEGADLAFEYGAKQKTIVYLPWQSFNSEIELLGRSVIITGEESPLLDGSVERYHPSPSKLSDGAKLLIRRDAAQVLGADCNTPSDAVVCYTPEAKKVGGTAQAIRIAEAYNIPVLNMACSGLNTASKVLNKLEEIWNLKIDTAPILFCKRDRQVYGWMSNFCSIPLIWEHPTLGMREWKSSEHAYQAAKTEDSTYALEIANSNKANEAKKLGQKLERLADPIPVMREIVRAKFQNSALAGMLLDTNERELIEDAPWDDFWGTGQGDGFNNLGKILMEIREEIV